MRKKKNSPYLSAQQRAQLYNGLRQQYDAGASVRTLAKLHGRSYTCMHGWLTEAGVEFRARGGWNGNQHKQKTRTRMNTNGGSG